MAGVDVAQRPAPTSPARRRRRSPGGWTGMLAHRCGFSLATSSSPRKPALSRVRRLPWRSAIRSAAGMALPATSPTAMARRPSLEVDDVEVVAPHGVRRAHRGHDLEAVALDRLEGQQAELDLPRHLEVALQPELVTQLEDEDEEQRRGGEEHPGLGVEDRVDRERPDLEHAHEEARPSPRRGRAPRPRRAPVARGSGGTTPRGRIATATGGGACGPAARRDRRGRPPGSGSGRCPAPRAAAGSAGPRR